MIFPEQCAISAVFAPVRAKPDGFYFHSGGEMESFLEQK